MVASILGQKRDISLRPVDICAKPEDIPLHVVNQKKIPTVLTITSMVVLLVICGSSNTCSSLYYVLIVRRHVPLFASWSEDLSLWSLNDTQERDMQ